MKTWEANKRDASKMRTSTVEHDKMAYPRKRQKSTNSLPTKRRRLNISYHPKSPIPRHTTASFQSPESTKQRENSNIISEDCDIMGDVQEDSLVDVFTQMRVDKEFDHVMWKYDEVCQLYQDLPRDFYGSEDQFQADIRLVGRILPLFVLTSRTSSVMLPEILRLKQHEYYPFGYL